MSEGHRQLWTEAQQQDFRERYLRVDTANVADVLDTLGHRQQGLSARFLPWSGTRLAGWAYPIRGAPVPDGPPTDERKVLACAGVRPGQVTVWTGNGSGACYFGELIALGLQQNGCVGALVDGGVRDLAWLRAAEFPVFATYRTPVQSIGRWQVVEWQQPIYLPGATSSQVVVTPEDFVLADEDGVLVVPGDLAEEVLVRAEQITGREVEIRAALRAGTSLQAAIERFGPI